MSAPASAQANQSNPAFTAVPAPATNPTLPCACVRRGNDQAHSSRWASYPRLGGHAVPPDSMEFAWQSLPELLCYAYGYKSLRFDGQVTGLPDWAVNQKYDIVAKMSATDISTFQKLSNDEQEHWREAMLQSLLAERFSLTLHHGQADSRLRDGRRQSGIKMKDAATIQRRRSLAKGRWQAAIHPPLVEGHDPHAGLFDEIPCRPSVDAAAQVGRPVLDKTGLTSTYNFTLDWSIYSQARRPVTRRKRRNLHLHSVGEIGLKLQPSTGSVETIVVDHIEKPTPN